jgi:hypothetical protein
MHALVVNVNGWLTELNPPGAGRPVVGDAVALPTSAIPRRGSTHSANSGRSAAANLSGQYVGVVDGALELAEVWAVLVDGHRTLSPS